MALNDVDLLNNISPNPASTNLYISWSNFLEKISKSFFALLVKPSTFFNSFLVCTSNLPPDLNLEVNSSNALNTDDFKPDWKSPNFQYSYLGIPILFVVASILLANVLDAAVTTGCIVLADTLRTGSTILDKPNPATLAPPLIVGPINFKVPIKAVPSAPNFNLFLNKAAALSLPVSPSNFSRDVLYNRFWIVLPSSLPKISPTLCWSDVDTVVSATAAGNIQ